MPLEWKRGKNPYVYNYFGILGVGPNTPYNKIVFKAQQLAKTKTSEEERHQVADAGSKLRGDEVRAAELLLVHPQPAQEAGQYDGTLKQLQEVAKLPQVHAPIPLQHPLGIFWFLPAPGPEAATWPSWEELRLIGPNDPGDLELDIIFDH